MRFALSTGTEIHNELSQEITLLEIELPFTQLAYDPVHLCDLKR